MLRIFNPHLFACSVLVGILNPIHITLADDSSVLKTIEVGYLKHIRERLPKLSNLALPADDDGILGIRQGIIDNNGTAKFIGQEFSYHAAILDVNDDPYQSFQQLYDTGIRHFIVDVNAHTLLKLSELSKDKHVWFYNIGARDDSLRKDRCEKNIFHIIPSYAMQADALAQYLIAKRWHDWFLVIGRRAADREFAQALRRSAKKFGADIVQEKTWTYGPDARRTAQSDVPVFTQGVNYDVLIVADTVGEFGEYLMYRTWEPKIVAGSQGLIPTSWHRTHEIWGAAQIQSRFSKNYGQHISERDYNAWLAIRALGEATTRTQSVEPAVVAKYLSSKQFELAGYKGQKLTFRTWNNQLRQPILLAWEKSLVSVSPQPQFLHQYSPLDTLGYDRPESQCNLL